MNRHISFAVLAVLAVSAAGCQRFGYSRPAPLPATPTPPVASGPLQPLDLPATETPVEQEPLEQTQVANVPAAPASPPPDAKEIGRSDMLGGWTVVSGSDNCKLFMTLTTWSGGYRANSRGCGSPALQKVSAWDLNGKQVVLKDDTGATIAQLYNSAPERFNGQTTTGSAISVFR